MLSDSPGTEPGPRQAMAPDAPLAVVGIGASAGGLAALRELFAHVPGDSGLAFVVIVHLSPEHESHLADLLQEHVRMPVQQVTETIALRKNNVYVIPPGCNLNSIDTHLRLSDLEKDRRARAPIDHFFRTLAKTHDGHSIGVILTGTGSDGTLGLKEIKQKGGLTVVQDPNEAEYDGMPQSAVTTGLVDLVLPLAQIPEAVLRFAGTNPRVVIPDNDQDLKSRERNLLQKVFAQIRARTGRDFTRYKRSTIMRRIQRRMQLHQVEELDQYVDLLRQRSDEVDALADEFLITVTSFFRDPEVFDVLEKSVIPKLFEGRGPNDQVRVWSVGCASGEEPFSLAMLLLEEAGKRRAPPRIQVFATDLHEGSLKIGRDGLYSGDIEHDVSAERLQRFFSQENGGYRVRTEVREAVVFAPHNLMGDPPFSRMDLISCRNLLIYLDRDVQRDVMALFHYALVPAGTLMVGTSETVDDSELFRSQHKKACIYRKRNVKANQPNLPIFPIARPPPSSANAEPPDPDRPISYGGLHQRMVERHAPPSMLVNQDHAVVHLSEHVGAYLVHPGGEPTASVFKLVREDLRVELRASLHLAEKDGRPVRSKPIQTRIDGEKAEVVLQVCPAGEQGFQGYSLVIFDKVPSEAPAGGPPARSGASSQELETEIALVKQRLQGVLKEYETSREEMRASSEEFQSTNEELRSTMEELETSKEELQSMNEELTTLNQENRHKVEELSQLSGDLQNLLAATDIATLFLSRDLRIMRFTPSVGDLFNVRVTDRGRPVSDLTHRLGYDEMTEDARRVLKHKVPVEREVNDEAGRWYLTRILPYRSDEDRIEGVVITFIDITGRKAAEEAVDKARVYAESIVETFHEPLLVLTSDLRVRTANQAFYNDFEVSAETTIGRNIYDLGNGQWDIPELRTLLEDILPDNEVFNDFEVRHDFENLGERVMLVNARRLDHVQLILLGIRDITEKKNAELALRESEEKYRTLFSEMDQAYAVVEVIADERGHWSDFRFLEVNPAFMKQSGMEDPVGKTATQILGTPNPKWAEVYGHVLETGEAVRIEEMEPVLDRTFDVSIFRAGDPESRRVAVLFSDITDRKRSERALIESEERHRLIVEGARDYAIFTTDPEGIIESWSQGAEAVFGWTPSEAIGQSAAITFTREDRERGVPGRELETARREGSAPDVRWHRRQNDTPVFIDGSTRVLTDGDGGVRGFLKIGQDVTERVRAEEALRESEARFRQMAEAVPDVVFTTSPDGIVEYVSPRREELTGHPPENALGTGMWPNLIHPDDRQRAVADRESAFSNNVPYESRYRLVLADGSFRWFIARARPILGVDGSVVRWFGTLTDVDDLTRAEMALQHLNESLEARVEMRTREVQQLAATLTMAEQEERRRIARILHDDLQQLLFGVHLRLNFLIQDIVALEREKLGDEFDQARQWVAEAIEITRQLSVDLSPPVLKDEGLNEALMWLANQMGEKHQLHVDLQLDPEIQIPDADLRTLYFQCIRELLFNVVKHAGASEARLRVTGDITRVHIMIADSGRGFDAAGFRKSGGSENGFGLFSIRERLRLVGGSLQVESAPGEGTRMSIVAPRLTA